MSSTANGASNAPSFFRGTILPPARIVGRFFTRGWRRLTGKPRLVEEQNQNLYPLVIQVLAGFSKNEGEVVEEEVDSVLGLLRHGFPGGVYEDMRRQFREALDQQQDLNSMAGRLSRMLSPEQKVVLGVQLYDIIARSDKSQQQMPTFYGFMDHLGMAAQAIEIVHQLQSGEKADENVAPTGELPLEVLTFGRDAQADVWLKSLRPGERLIAFRYQALTLLKKQIEDHHKWTGSLRARHILDHWNESRAKFVKVFPNEYKRALGELNASKETGATIAKAKAADAKTKSVPAK